MNFKELKKTIMVFAVLIAITPVSGETAEDIIDQVDNRQISRSEISDLSMTVIDDTDRREDNRIFRLQSFSREDANRSELSVFIFREPRRLSGMAILTRDDGQWVYFPSTGRVRLLSGAARSGSINGVGGDFSYEDLGTGNWNKDYSFRLITEDDLQWTLEGVPRSVDSGYSKILMSIGKEDYIPRRIEYYRNGREPEKILSVLEVEAFSGRLNPSVMEMVNQEKGSATIIRFHSMEFDEPLSDNLFHPRQFYK